MAIRRSGHAMNTCYQFRIYDGYDQHFQDELDQRWFGSLPMIGDSLMVNELPMIVIGVDEGRLRLRVLFGPTCIKRLREDFGEDWNCLHRYPETLFLRKMIF